MSKTYLVNEADLTAIADAIRAKNETTESLTFPTEMVAAIEAFSGGLNIEFIAIASEDALPETAKENTVAIITETPIGEWQLSVTEPSTRADGTELIDGDIWIIGGLTEDTLLPQLVYQYNNGMFGAARSAIFQNEVWTWMDTKFYLYSYNNPTSYMAGELLKKGFMRNPADSGYASWEKEPTISDAGVMTINYAKNHAQILSCLYYFRNKVNLTNYSSLCLLGSTTDNNDNWSGLPHMAVIADINDPTEQAAYTSGSKTNPVLDVSNLTGEYYIGFDMMSQGSTSPGTILVMKELYLE